MRRKVSDDVSVISQAKPLQSGVEQDETEEDVLDELRQLREQRAEEDADDSSLSDWSDVQSEIDTRKDVALRELSRQGLTGALDDEEWFAQTTALSDVWQQSGQEIDDEAFRWIG